MEWETQRYDFRRKYREIDSDIREFIDDDDQRWIWDEFAAKRFKLQERELKDWINEGCIWLDRRKVLSQRRQAKRGYRTYVLEADLLAIKRILGRSPHRRRKPRPSKHTDSTGQSPAQKTPSNNSTRRPKGRPATRKPLADFVDKRRAAGKTMSEMRTEWIATHDEKKAVTIGCMRQAWKRHYGSKGKRK
jgi:hypothetical protein